MEQIREHSTLALRFQLSKMTAETLAKHSENNCLRLWIVANASIVLQTLASVDDFEAQEYAYYLDLDLFNETERCEALKVADSFFR